jgi:hypothetical protein
MKIQVKNARLSFSSLWTAVAFNKDDTEDKKKFKASLLVTKGSQMAATIDAAILATAEAKWPGKGKATIESIKGNPNRFAWQNGDLKDWDGYAGNMALTAKNTVMPLIIGPVGITKASDKEPGRKYTDPNATGVMFPILEPRDGMPFDGCYVNATVEAFGYDDPGKGISFSLKAVQYARKGDAFAGGAPANPDDFESLSVEEENTESDDLAG